MASKLHLNKAVQQIKTSSEETCCHISYTIEKQQGLTESTIYLHGCPQVGYWGSDNVYMKVSLLYHPFTLQPIDQIQPVPLLKPPPPNI